MTRADLGSAMSKPGKLVRDKIPEIIRAEGLEPIVHIASTGEYAERLRDKLREEVTEFLDSDNDVEELADVIEVVYALAELAGANREQLEALRGAKAEKAGAFDGRLVWSGNRPPGHEA
jgi:predicted house-cleaning noncanonical NTP pyrophosphatase (MazG superfamily)